MPYKVWAVNEILTAADMNTYVGNQTILSFAGTAERGSAIGTAVEGMLSYVGSGVVEVYAGTATGWTTISGGGGGVTIGTAAPSTPSDGDLWWDSDNGKLFVYYTDATPTSQWVDAAGPSVAVQATAPTGYEGQLWLDSTDGSMYTYYTDPGGTASSWIGAVSRSGGILQVVSTTKTDVFTSGSSNTWVDVTGLSATITPRSTSSKIFVVTDVKMSPPSTDNTAAFSRVLRGSTETYQGDASGAKITAMGGITQVSNNNGRIQSVQTGGTFLDSPSTSSSVTYKVQLFSAGATGANVNKATSETDNNYYGRYASSITLIEVAG